MLLSTSEIVHGKEIGENLGVVTGSSVRARAIGRDIISDLRSLVGGEIKEYAELQTQTRNRATEILVESAGAMGADAVIALRYVSSDINARVSEILAYGTAVKFK